ncbi:MAG: hypothetical protein GY771_04915 [bacterium]|nr:hypothetical protein [bacterium]
MDTGKTTLRIGLIVLAIAVAFAGAGCIFGTDDRGIQGEKREPTSPENVIYNLERSYNEGDIQLYKQCLSPNYTFYFNPSDVGIDVDGYIIPSSWGYEEDWTATQNLFENAYSVTMDLPVSDIGEPDAGDTTYTASNITISLLVMFDADTGLIANKGTLEFVFETYDSNGKTYWRIKDWRDFTYA